MKKLVIATTMAVGILAVSGCSSDNSETVVETEAGNVTKDEFYTALKNSQEGDAILYDLVVKKLLDSNYEVDEEEVDTRVDEMKEQIGDQFDMYLQQQGLADEDALREQLEYQLAQEKFITDGIEITDEEVQERYDRMQKGNITARHILVEDEETANEVKEKLDNGEDFAELAGEYSTDPGSAQNGGELQAFGPGQMVKPFEDAAYTLDVNVVSEPVESTHGWHVIEVLDVAEPTEEIDPLEDMQEDLKNQMALQKGSQNVQDRLIKLMEDANIEVKDEDFEPLFEQIMSASA